MKPTIFEQYPKITLGLVYVGWACLVLGLLSYLFPEVN